MGNNNKKEKFNREKCRQEIAKQYNEEIRALKDKINELYEQRIANAKTIEAQQKKIAEQEEQINLYRMIVNMPESEIARLISNANTKSEFLEAIHKVNKILNLY